MKLSLIMPTRNRARYLPQTLDSIAAISTSFSWEFIVINNDSTDETATVLEEYKSKLNCPFIVGNEEKRGSGNAKNRALSLASGEIAAFTDDDCYPAKDFVDQVINCFTENTRLGFIGGRILLFDQTDAPFTVQYRQDRVDISPGDFIPAGLIQGANFSFRRAALDEIGGFDGLFGAGASFSGDDIESIARVSANGWHGAYDPRPVVYHHHRRKTMRSIKKLFRRYDYGRGAYFMKCLLIRKLRPAYAKAWGRSLLTQKFRVSSRELIGGARYLMYKLTSNRSKK